MEAAKVNSSTAGRAVGVNCSAVGRAVEVSLAVGKAVKVKN